MPPLTRAKLAETATGARVKLKSLLQGFLSGPFRFCRPPGPPVVIGLARSACGARLGTHMSTGKTLWALFGPESLGKIFSAGPSTSRAQTGPVTGHGRGFFRIR